MAKQSQKPIEVTKSGNFDLSTGEDLIGDHQAKLAKAQSVMPE